MVLQTAGQMELEHQKDLERLRALRPMDDDFMRCLFKDNIPLVEFVLRIFTEKPDLKIIKCQTQKDMKRLVGARSLCLDAYGEDSEKKKYDMEVQRADKGSEPQRARYHSSVIDVENLDARQKFTDLPETYVIFITEKDFFGEGKPVYRIERMNLDTGKPFADGEHILYVNGEYRGDSDIGKLMHDFSCSNPDDMNFKLMADSARYLKENPKGVSQMCKILEEMKDEYLQIGVEKGREEGEKEGRSNEKRETVFRMLTNGSLTLENISEFSGLPLDEVKKLNSTWRGESNV